jgi:hypothetical protein
MQIKTRVAGVFAVTAVAVAAIGGPAFADNAPNVGNVTGIANFSLASGNNIDVPVNLPINICGAAVSILGFSNAGCRGGAGVINDSGNTSNGNNDSGFGFGGF